MNQQMSLLNGHEVEYIVGFWVFTTFYDKRRKKWHWLMNGRETFYNDKDEMMEWDTEEEAIKYLEKTYSTLLFIQIGGYNISGS